jgi:hypothetical protein
MDILLPTHKLSTEGAFRELCEFLTRIGGTPPRSLVDEFPEGSRPLFGEIIAGVEGTLGWKRRGRSVGLAFDMTAGEFLSQFVFSDQEPDQ